MSIFNRKRCLTNSTEITSKKAWMKTPRQAERQQARSWVSFPMVILCFDEIYLEKRVSSLFFWDTSRERINWESTSMLIQYCTSLSTMKGTASCTFWAGCWQGACLPQHPPCPSSHPPRTREERSGAGAGGRGNLRVSGSSCPSRVNAERRLDFPTAALVSTRDSHYLCFESQREKVATATLAGLCCLDTGGTFGLLELHSLFQ